MLITILNILTVNDKMQKTPNKVIIITLPLPILCQYSPFSIIFMVYNADIISDNLGIKGIHTVLYLVFFVVKN